MSIIYNPSPSELDELILCNNNILVITFGANYCKPCRGIHSNIKNYVNNNDDVTYVDININDDYGYEIQESYDITVVPYIMIYYNDTCELSSSGKNILSKFYKYVRNK
jgi:thiol-disulfide isomerase/thioredoxin